MAHWLNRGEDGKKQKSTRARSSKQEKRLSEEFDARTTPNSGATFGENDLRSDRFDIEAKTTGKGSYSVKVSELKKAKQNARAGLTPLFVIEFSEHGEEVVVIGKDDFLEIINSQSGT